MADPPLEQFGLRSRERCLTLSQALAEMDKIMSAANGKGPVDPKAKPKK